MKHIIAGAAFAAVTFVFANANAADMSSAEIQKWLAPGTTFSIPGVGTVRVLDSHGAGEIIKMSGRDMTSVFTRNDQLCYTVPVGGSPGGGNPSGTFCANIAQTDAGKLRATYDNGKVVEIAVVAASEAVAAMPSSRMLPKVR